MDSHEVPALAGWLVVATLPMGERYVVMPADSQPVDQARATVLARSVDWHRDVHAVGEAVRVWRAADREADAPDGERYHLPMPWTGPVEVATEPGEAPPIGQGATSEVFYLVNGEPFAGTVTDYVRAHELAQLDVVDVPNVVWTWKVVPTPYAPGGASWGWAYHYVDVEVSEDDDGHTTVTLRLLRHRAQYRHLTR